MIISLDIETIRHPDVPPSDKDVEEDRCPAAPHHRIVAAAGVVLEPMPAGQDLWYSADRAVTFGRGSTEERAILEHLAQAFRNQPKIIGWNTSGFDLRVIHAACMEHGIQCPYLASREVNYRYSMDGHDDMMDRLSSYGAARRAQQQAYALRSGLPGKLDVDGSHVADLVKAGKWTELWAYNMQDSGQLGGVWLRDEYVAGRLTLAGYRQSAASLVSLFESTPGLRPIVESERFDRKRFLLENA